MDPSKNRAALLEDVTHRPGSLWPKRVSVKLAIQLILFSFRGVTLFQTPFLKGIELTSPAKATEMLNLAPGMIFIIMWTVRLEKVKDGGVTSATSSSPSGTIFDKDKNIGCMYLVASVFCLSSNIVLQASTLGDFPAPMSFFAITSLIGVFTTMLVELLEKHRIDLVGSVMTFGNLVRHFLTCLGVISGVGVSFNGWAMKKRDPVHISMFSLIGTDCFVVTLGDSFQLGSFAGMFLMFVGLYFVLWPKGKDNHGSSEERWESEFDQEKPLLS